MKVRSLLTWTVFLFAAPSGAIAEEVSLADLAGTTIHAAISRDQLVQREGRSFKVHMEQTWEISVSEDHKSITLKTGTTATTPRGTRTAKPNAGSFVIGEPRPVPSRGGGTAMWSFADGTLTFTRTFQSGAFRAHFALKREGDGMTCTAAEAFARENGDRPIRLESAFGGEILMLDARQVGGGCRIARPQ